MTVQSRTSKQVREVDYPIIPSAAKFVSWIFPGATNKWPNNMVTPLWRISTFYSEVDDPCNKNGICSIYMSSLKTRVGVFELIWSVIILAIFILYHLYMYTYFSYIYTPFWICIPFFFGGGYSIHHLCEDCEDRQNGAMSKETSRRNPSLRN